MRLPQPPRPSATNDESRAYDTEQLVVGGHRRTVRRARSEDVSAIVALLADDQLGKDRESDDLDRYLAAFTVIDADPHQFLAVVDDEAGAVVGTLQLTLLPGLSRGATTRLQIEGVRVAASERGTGLGSALFEWAHRYGTARGATLAQLTTDLRRERAHGFYDALGYEHTHAGMKRPLP